MGFAQQVCRQEGMVCRGRAVRAEFPLLAERDVVFFDSAASAQKPRVVLDAMNALYTKHYANVHRGVYALSQESTTMVEEARGVVRRFLNAKSENEIVMTHGATESINLVAQSWGRTFLKQGDEIIVTILEHHANFVPWQVVANERGAKIHYVGLDGSGHVSLEEFNRVLSPRTKFVAVSGLANALGVKPPIREIVRRAHEVSALVLVDASQLVSHEQIDVQALDVDFLVFSGHKVYGPTGIGILYGREELLNAMPPFLCGGDMIRNVSIHGTTFREAPHRFEAGTPPIAEAVGLAAALGFVSEIGFDAIRAHDRELVALAVQGLRDTPTVRVLGPADDLCGLVTFVSDSVHPHDMAQFLDHKGIAVRAGHHCAQPLMEYLGEKATTRASFGVYNTPAEVEHFIKSVGDAVRFFGESPR